MKFKIGDQVQITAGKNKNKKGKIKQVLPKTDQVVVEGLNLFKKHLRPRQTGGQGQIIQKERPLPTSSIALICPKCHQPTRIGYTLGKDNHKHRLCKKCQSPLIKSRQK